MLSKIHSASWLSVKEMMNTNFKLLRTEDTLLTVVAYYQECKVVTLPVVDEAGKLIGVFPKKRLYRALLEGASLDHSCAPWVVYNPIHLSVDLTYNELSLAVRVTRSKVDVVVVVNSAGEVMGLIGTAEYLRASLSVILRSLNLVESLFNSTYEGIIIVDKKGHILNFNPTAEGMFAMQFADVEGKHLNEVFPEITLLKKRRLGSKGTIKGLPVIVNQIPIEEESDQNQAGTIITLLDVSDAEEIANELEVVKEMESTLGGVLGAASDGMLISDTSGKIRYVNERASNLVLKTPKSIIGKSIDEFLRNDSAISALNSGLPEIAESVINGQKCIVSHSPIKAEKDGKSSITSVVSTIYLDDEVLTEELAIKLLSLKQQVNYYRSELEKRGGGESSNFEQIISRNPDFNKLKNEARRIARSSSTVLLTGESGVGKDMFSRAIHASSPRASYPFIKVNCAAIPETLLESELFGYAPGSFTGASKKGKPGYFEQADKGTIFLDEIGDMPLSVQIKILHVLQEKQFMRVGGTTTQTVDVRIIAATNRDLRDAIAKGTFREDLFYRLNVIAIHLPPLRERYEDIVPLAKKFMEKYNNILGSTVSGITPEACRILENYSWPGNIRELENAIERAANYVWDGKIGTEHLPADILVPLAPKSLEPTEYRSVLYDVDREIIVEALKKTNGNKSAAARMLKLSRSALYDKLSKYDLF